MNVIKIGDLYKTSRITGPKHNYLGLAVSYSPPAELDIVPITIDHEDVAPQVDEIKLVAAVTAGVQAASKTNGKSLYVHRIEFVPTDSPDYEAYTQLATAIAKAASQDQRSADVVEASS